MRKRRCFPAVVSIGTVTGQLAPALASVHVKLRTTVGNVAAVVNRFIYCIWPITLKAYTFLKGTGGYHHSTVVCTSKLD